MLPPSGGAEMNGMELLLYTISHSICSLPVEGQK